MKSLEHTLRRELGGEVAFGSQAKALFATDASVYRHVPLGVVFPHDAADLEAAVAACRRHDAAILPRGAGTSLAGQTANRAVVIDCSRHMHRVLEVDPERRLARVQPGCVLDRLQEAARTHGLAFGPDPATHAVCTVGGMLGNNSCGMHSVTAGRTSDNVHGLEVLTYGGTRLTARATSKDELSALLSESGSRGELYRRLVELVGRHGDLIRSRYPKLPRRVSGYNLDDLLPENGCHLGRALVGSEGTCAVLLEATLELVPRLPHRVLVLLGWPTLAQAADRVPDVLEAGRPALTALEGVERHLIDTPHVRTHLPAALALWPTGDGCLMVETAAETADGAAEQGRLLSRRLAAGTDPPDSRLVVEPAEQALVWRVRDEALAAAAHGPEQGVTHPGWEDSAVPPERLGPYVRELEQLTRRYGYHAARFGHFGDGCLHAHFDFDLESESGIAAFRRFMEEAADLVVAHGGSLSGEHGDGQARGELLTRMFGPEVVEVFREFKGIWDPEGRLNPGNLVDPRPLDANLRPWSPAPGRDPATVFRFAADGGSFAHAVGRCVGVGKCRRTVGGTMCPSFRATGEEEHSTRGRARLLGEMLRGEVVRGGWRSGEVQDALSLCLSCKACKSECPAGVDMASLKAEFLHHRYRRRLRPPAAYGVGFVSRWARWGTASPALAALLNRLGGSPAAAPVKALLGIHPTRRLPRLTTERFDRWLTGRPESQGGKRPVVFFPDTFTRYFQPEIGRATVELLEAAGMWVTVPKKPVCCGRPLYDWGMLKTAKRWLRRVMDELAPEIAAGVPVVVPEPSCASVFRDELPDLFPDEPAAQALSQSVLLPTALLADLDWPTPQLSGRALLHVHCHQKAVLSADADRRFLERLGLEVETPDTGCCGMAGAFGFEKGSYDVSRAVGERVLLPAVREAGAETRVVTAGFSCREQIFQETGRGAVHPVVVACDRMPV